MAMGGGDDASVWVHGKRQEATCLRAGTWRRML